jgi:hypothetical protein
MHHRPEDDRGPEADAAVNLLELTARRARCVKAAVALWVAGSGGLTMLCLWGLRPAARAIPVFFATTWLLLASATAALLARIAHLQIRDADDDGDDDGGGPGRGTDPQENPSGGGGIEFDWRAFERDFRAYCERTPALRA